MMMMHAWIKKSRRGSTVETATGLTPDMTDEMAPEARGSKVAMMLKRFSLSDLHQLRKRDEVVRCAGEKRRAGWYCLYYMLVSGSCQGEWKAPLAKAEGIRT